MTHPPALTFSTKMIVRTLEHGQLVIDRFYAIWKNQIQQGKIPFGWIATDTETAARAGWGENDALVIGRTQMRVFSMCFQGESYCFVTSAFDPDCPLPSEWLDLFKPLLLDRSVVKVFHNANYDLNVFWTEGMAYVRNIYCTMIGVWKANASLEKSLKDRAPLYGRHLGSLHISKEMRKLGFVSVSEQDLQDYAAYAEEDVIATDEIFQTQIFGSFVRNAKIGHINARARLEFSANPMPAGTVKLTEETLTMRDRLEIQFQELPYLRATIRAEQRGFPFNRGRLQKIRRKLTEDIDNALRKVFQLAGSSFNMNSQPQMTELFERLGIESPDRTKKGKPSFKAAALFKIKDSHPVIAAITTYKELQKLQSVYVGDPSAENAQKKLGLEYYALEDGLIRASANTVGAVTGRGSSSNPNLTQIPSAKDIYGIKDCFTPTR